MNEDVDFLDVLLNQPKPMIRESAFRKTYLPLLFSADPSVFNLRWLNEVCQNPYLEVDVVDDENTIIYTVPPLRKAVNTGMDQSVAMVANLAKMESQVHQVRAAAVLNNNLPRVLRFADARSDEIQARWADLLTRLGYGDYVMNGSPSNPANSSMGTGVALADDNDGWN